MSKENQQNKQANNQQPTVRHIPIFVEGRSEPLINKIPETQPTSNNATNTAIPDPPRMEKPSHNTNDIFKQGSIFDGKRNYPFPNSPFFHTNSAAHESSPAREIPVHVDGSANEKPTVIPQHQSAQSQTRGSSVPRQTPPPASFAQQEQQYRQQQAQRYHEEQAAKQPPTGIAVDQTDSRQKVSTSNDPIAKIQKIQQDVLDIFDQVERFQGGKDGKQNKTYIYLDEMLTQNLLKLDSIDVEDQPQIKSARKDAIKSINQCIAVLEAKAEAAAANAQDDSNNEPVPNGMTTNKTSSGASLSHSSSNSSSQQQQEQRHPEDAQEQRQQ